MSSAVVELRPQPGPQETFLATSADIAIYGGAAGGGKSYALLLEPLRHIAVPDFGAVIFRRTLADVTKEGGLWDTSAGLYKLLGAVPNVQLKKWLFNTSSRIGFGHLEHETTKYDWQGAQIALLLLDELTHFSKSQFFYMLSRNRSTCGVRPYVRATCNPDADSWVAEFIAWWIDQDTGYAIPERSGVIRWMLRRGEDLHWGDSQEELLQRFPDAEPEEPKSVTFIVSSVFDNKILLERDPGYLGNLKALDLVERERLLRGNWKIRPAAGLYFKRHYFEIVDVVPADAKRIRRWDLAATEPADGQDPDWTVGLKLARDGNGVCYVEHVERLQASPARVEQAILTTAAHDGKECLIGLPQDPGQAGKAQARNLTTMLAGYTVRTERETGSKVVRASAVSAQAEVGNVKLLRGAWNEAFLTELENFPSPKSKDDQVDALAGAFNELNQKQAQPRIRGL
jgi:predicted phage terminase large subunit-like protein